MLAAVAETGVVWQVAHPVAMEQMVAAVAKARNEPRHHPSACRRPDSEIATARRLAVAERIRVRRFPRGHGPDTRHALQ